MKYVSLF